jgi:hypothetical protein
VLGAAAVLMALLAYAIGSAARALFFIEGGCILAILLAHRLGKGGRWHERAVNYRILAEMLRQMMFLAPAGLSLSFANPPGHSRERADLRATWMHWHFSAIVRAAGLPAAKYGPPFWQRYRAFLLEEWIDVQIAYHRENARQLRLALLRCEQAAIGLFVGTAVACGAHLLWHWPSIIVLAAGLPAWAAAIHGIRSQGEFERLSERSKSMYGRLTELKDEMGRMTSSEATGELPGLRDFPRVVASEMLEEVNDWQVLYRAHPIPLP